MDWSEYDRAALVVTHRDLIPYLEMGQLHQGRIKNDALRISNFRNRLDHPVILCFTAYLSKLFHPLLGAAP